MAEITRRRIGELYATIVGDDNFGPLESSTITEALEGGGCTTDAQQMQASAPNHQAAGALYQFSEEVSRLASAIDSDN